MMQCATAMHRIVLSAKYVGAIVVLGRSTVTMRGHVQARKSVEASEQGWHLNSIMICLPAHSPNR